MTRPGTAALGIQSSPATTATKRATAKKNAFSHQQDNMLVIDANGKRYKNNSNNNVADKHDTQGAEPIYEDTHVRAITNLSLYHHLNWQATLNQLQPRVAPRPVSMMQSNFCTPS